MNELQQSLDKCKVEGNTLFLPPMNKEPLKNYQEVRKALLNCGAKYKNNSFIFPNAAQPYIDRLMNSEKVNLKKEFQFFPTPPALADQLVELAEIKGDHKILEPSAGQGAIILAIQRSASVGTVVHYCELMEINRNVLSSTVNRILCQGHNFLEIPPTYKNYYDRIIANPPFSKNQDIDHILKMYECLKPGGRLVSLCSPHIDTFGKKEEAFREWTTEVGATFLDVPAGTFKESGTNIKTYIVIINKPETKNQTMSTPTEKTVEQLQQDVEKLKKALNNPAISGNPGLLASTKKRLAAVEAEVKAKGGKAPAPAAAKPVAKPAAKPAAPAPKKAEPAKKAAAPVAKKPAAKPAAAPKKEKKNIATRSKRELMEMPKVKAIIAKDYTRHRLHYELFHKAGLTKLEVSVVSGATPSNIGRDLLFYKVGKLKAD